MKFITIYVFQREGISPLLYRSISSLWESHKDEIGALQKEDLYLAARKKRGDVVLYSHDENPSWHIRRTFVEKIQGKPKVKNKTLLVKNQLELKEDETIIPFKEFFESLGVDDKYKAQSAALGIFLRNVAKQKGIVLDAIAKKTGMTEGNVLWMLSGKRRPELKTFLRVTDAIGLVLQFQDKDGIADIPKAIDESLQTLSKRMQKEKNRVPRVREDEKNNGQQT